VLNAMGLHGQERHALQTAQAEAAHLRDTLEIVRQESEALQAELLDAKGRLKQSQAETAQARARHRELDNTVRHLRGEKAALSRLVLRQQDAVHEEVRKFRSRYRAPLPALHRDADEGAFREEALEKLCQKARRLEPVRPGAQLAGSVLVIVAGASWSCVSVSLQVSHQAWLVFAVAAALHVVAHAAKGAVLRRVGYEKRSDGYEKDVLLNSDEAHTLQTATPSREVVLDFLMPMYEHLRACVIALYCDLFLLLGLLLLVGSILSTAPGLCDVVQESHGDVLAGPSAGLLPARGGHVSCDRLDVLVPRAQIGLFLVLQPLVLTAGWAGSCAGYSLRCAESVMRCLMARADVLCDAGLASHAFFDQVVDAVEACLAQLQHQQVRFEAQVRILFVDSCDAIALLMLLFDPQTLLAALARAGGSAYVADSNDPAPAATAVFARGGLCWFFALAGLGMSIAAPFIEVFLTPKGTSAVEPALTAESQHRLLLRFLRSELREPSRHRRVVFDALRRLATDFCFLATRLLLGVQSPWIAKNVWCMAMSVAAVWRYVAWKQECSALIRDHSGRAARFEARLGSLFIKSEGRHAKSRMHSAQPGDLDEEVAGAFLDLEDAEQAFIELYTRELGPTPSWLPGGRAPPGPI